MVKKNKIKTIVRKTRNRNTRRFSRDIAMINHTFMFRSSSVHARDFETVRKYYAGGKKKNDRGRKRNAPLRVYRGTK